MSYSDVEVAEALIRLAANKYDFNKTAEELKLPPQTLRRWNKSVPKKGVGDLLERAIERLLMNVPEGLKGNDWAVTIGILMDKWLLMQGEPTSRTEGIFRGLESLSDADRQSIVAEAERILAQAAGGRAGAGGAQS